jgi:hypothetical protein
LRVQPVAVQQSGHGQDYFVARGVLWLGLLVVIGLTAWLLGFSYPNQSGLLTDISYVFGIIWLFPFYRYYMKPFAGWAKEEEARRNTEKETNTLH